MSANPPTVSSTLLSELAEKRPLGVIALGVPAETAKPIVIPPAVIDTAFYRHDEAVRQWDEAHTKHERHAKEAAYAKRDANSLSREIGELASFLAEHAPDRLETLKKNQRGSDLPSEFPVIE